MSRYIDMLNTSGLNWEGALTEMCNNFTRTLFDDPELQYLQATGGEDCDYIAIDFDEIDVFHNGIETSLSENTFSICNLFSVGQISSCEVSDVNFVEFGNRILIDNTETDMLVEKTIKDKDNLDEEMYDVLIELMFFLYVNDPTGTYRAMDRVSKSFKNYFSENVKHGITKTIKSGSIKPRTI